MIEDSPDQSWRSRGRAINVAQAVLLVAYEWYHHEAPPVKPGLQTPDLRPATRAELIGLFEHLETVRTISARRT